MVFLVIRYLFDLVVFRNIYGKDVFISDVLDGVIVDYSYCYFVVQAVRVGAVVDHFTSIYIFVNMVVDHVLSAHVHYTQILRVEMKLFIILREKLSRLIFLKGIVWRYCS